MFKLFMALLWGVCLESIAYPFLSDDELEKQQVSMAAYHVEQAKENYLKKYNDCVTQSKKTVLSPDDFKGISLSEQEVKIILLYFSAKTHQACVGDFAEKYLMAINVARSFDVPVYSVVDDPQSERSIYLAASLAIDVLFFYPNYLQIGKEKRDRVEKIASINQVFNMTESLNALKGAF